MSAGSAWVGLGSRPASSLRRHNLVGTCPSVGASTVTTAGSRALKLVTSAASVTWGSRGTAAACTQADARLEPPGPGYAGSARGPPAATVVTSPPTSPATKAKTSQERQRLRSSARKNIHTAVMPLHHQRNRRRPRPVSARQAAPGNKEGTPNRGGAPLTHTARNVLRAGRRVRGPDGRRRGRKIITPRHKALDALLHLLCRCASTVCRRPGQRRGVADCRVLDWR